MDEFPLDSMMSIPNLPVQVIQPDDRLSIQVSAFDDKAAAPFNQKIRLQMGQNPNLMNQNPLFNDLYGYLVDERGMIDFPVFGQIPVAGLTLEEAKDVLYDSLAQHMNDAVVDIRYLNRRYTIVGEVFTPGTLPIDRNRMNVIDAIQRAGGMTQYARRDNILVIRETNGIRTYGRLDFRGKSAFDSPYYYVHNNDVIYIEPLQAKTATVQSPFLRYLSYLTGLLSTASIIIALTSRGN